MRLTPFRFTIERLRTLVLLAGALLIAALIGSLAVSHWKNRLNLSEIPKKLGVDIEQEANGVTYTQSRDGHTLFKIHASKVVQLKAGGRALLHNVQIELYSADGSSVDRIAGNDFEYDQKAGLAVAAGPVEITLMKPGTAPALAPKASAQQPGNNRAKGTPLANAAESVAAGQIQVKTSGLIFNQKTGMATTAQPVQFALMQGKGSAVGATFDSNHGQVVLDHAVELTVWHGAANVVLHAQHAEFERSALECDLTGAMAEYRNAKATAGQSRILFRQDGSAVRLDARDGFALATASGGHVSAPQGWIEFDKKNQPTHGHLEGGVTMDSVTGGRQAHGAAPVAEIEFGAAGALKKVHLERGVAMHSEEDVAGAHVSRDWRSPVANVIFRTDAKGKTQLDAILGQGGVMMTAQTRRGNGSMSPSEMSADAVTAKFDANGRLERVVGTGRASVKQTTAQGAVQTTAGDRVTASFATSFTGGAKKNAQTASQIESATVDGNVVMTQRPAQKMGQPPQPELRATAAHAAYEGAGAWVHLTGSPRVVNGGLELTADRVDVAQQTGNGGGDAFARGNVKATWVNDGRDKNSSGSVGLGGQTPAHVIAAEAQFHQATGEATFRGRPTSPARLWQDANSVAAPVIVLNRTKQTLVAHGSGAGNPVRVVLLSAGGAPGHKPSTPEVIRVRGGELEYADAARRVVMRGGRVTAEMETARSSSDSVELSLLPTGSHAAGAQGSGASQVDKMTARGNVVLTAEGRQGTGEQLVYSSWTGEYVLTGTAARPPKLSDPARGTVSGTALIFNSRDDSVSIEGAGHKTTTETTVTRAPVR